MVGKSLGAYEVLEPLGAGGMGDVYRARDTTLERDVAIKVLPEDLAADPERLARLEREAKLLASLNHPNIATIHALEQAAGVRFLVLELIRGESLARLLARGLLPPERAIDLCRQVAEGLEAAHDAGVIHRDLKPANVVITPDDRAKILDFGIAKSTAADADVAATSHATDLTVAGTLVGTPSYMSPEQVRGGALDKRADIWAFGCLLYECLTGRAAFARETLADTLAAIVDQEPDWRALPENVSPRIGNLVARCLRKDPRRRLRDIGDAWVEIEEATGASGVAAATAPGWAEEARPPTAAGLTWRLAVPAAIALALVAATATWYLTRDAAAPPTGITRFAFTLPDGARLAPTVNPAVSPDGELFVYQGITGGPGLYVRRRDETAVRPLEGGENGRRPFFSSDGEWIGFNNGPDLMKVSVAGGSPVTLCRSCAYPSSDGDWSPDGNSIVFEFRRSLWRVPASGGDPVLVAEPNSDDGEVGYDRPDVLPGGRAMLIEVDRESESLPSIAVLDLDSDRVRILDEGASRPTYAATGHIVFIRGTAADPWSLYAVAFDVESQALIGTPALLAQDVGGFGLSRGGTLTFIPSPVPGPAARRLVWVDHSGNTSAASEQVRPFHRVSIAPDQRRVAVTLKTAAGSSISIFDRETDVFAPLTIAGADSPVWSPRGDWLAYVSSADGAGSIARTFPDRGPGDSEVLLISDSVLRPSAVTPDESLLVYEEGPTGARDIKALPLGEDRTPIDVAVTASDEIAAALSPDGHWIAYMATVPQASFEIFVAAFPGPGLRRQVSNGGGASPLWSPDGTQLFFVARRGADLMVVDVTTEPELDFSPPTRLLSMGDKYRFELTTAQRYDISADGQRFLMVEPIEAVRPRDEINVIVNWFAELRERVPGGR